MIANCLPWKSSYAALECAGSVWRITGRTRHCSRRPLKVLEAMNDECPHACLKSFQVKPLGRHLNEARIELRFHCFEPLNCVGHRFRGLLRKEYAGRRPGGKSFSSISDHGL